MSALDDALHLARQVPPAPAKPQVREQHDPRNEAAFQQLLRETVAALTSMGIAPTPTWLRLTGGWDETTGLQPVAPSWPLRIFALNTDGEAWPYLHAEYQPDMLDKRGDYPGFGPGSKGLWVEHPGYGHPQGITFRDFFWYAEDGVPLYRPPTSGWESYGLSDGFLERLKSHPHWDGQRLPLVDAIALGISELA
ncbi:hypothetical protein GCM10025867_46330 (plasmid) [Frondihabitans sucicola]|uniref:Uncharacterized protein n=1 Tax=Frondihabitans sucicola TaxID=1268041 RepID=A0ABM8GV97_9MICO|nr:hypothetical protein [Frondihabitans sucicola]BDZ52392.1 hypothetical protein GCM10025867_46330 [Frondihabitans sucicola]